MALSSEQRALHARDIARLRHFWSYGGHESLAHIAVADHLTACESLLREIAYDSVGFSSNPMDHVKATYEWSEKARALLGPVE